MQQLDQVFGALSDPTRRAIVRQLVDGERSLSNLAEPFAMSQTAVTKHINVLADAGLVAVTKRGRTRYCSLQASAMKQASDWLLDYQSYWTRQLEALGNYLNEDQP